jgi:hypothetical protein
VRCDLCDKEFNNTDELRQHKEQMHPMDQRDTPDMDRENPEIEREMPEPEPTGIPVERTP